MAEIITKSVPDFATVFEFCDGSTGEAFGVSLATLIQCLCIAEQRHLVPPLEAAWELVAVPTAIRKMSKIDSEPN